MEIKFNQRRISCFIDGKYFYYKKLSLLLAFFILQKWWNRKHWRFVKEGLICLTELLSWKLMAQVRYSDVFIAIQKFRPPDSQLPIFSQKIIPFVGLMLCVVLLGKQEDFFCSLLIPLYLYGVKGCSSPVKPAASLSLSMYLLLQEAYGCLISSAQGHILRHIHVMVVSFYFSINFATCYVEEIKTWRYSSQNRQ